MEGTTVRRSGLLLSARAIDNKIWLWSSQRHVTKREIQIYAKQLYQESGLINFKASDGWYRRWKFRWKQQNTSSTNLKTDTIKRLDTINDLCNKTENENNKIIKDNSTEKQQIDKIKKDCSSNNNKTNRLNDKKITKTIIKKKGERYLPHFKHLVVAHAVENSINKSSEKFNVNKETVSGWVKNITPSLTNVNKEEKAKIEDIVEKEFVSWLKEVREEKSILTRNELIEKIKNIDGKYKNSIKNTCWYFHYSKRLQNDDNERNEIRKKYPAEFRKEIALFASDHSKKYTSKLFSVGRKQISSWIEQLKAGNTKKCNSHYVTDKNIDKEIWDWYQNQTLKPNMKQIRTKAIELYHNAGYKTMKCSSGWYTRWKLRYSVIQPIKQSENDVHLLSWILGELDKNKSITLNNLINQVETIKGSKGSQSWSIRFSKRCASDLVEIINGAKCLPKVLEEKTTSYTKNLLNLINRIPNTIFVATMDEIPLNFIFVDSRKSNSVLRKSEFDNCFATLIVSYLSNGLLLPTTIVFKSSLKPDRMEDDCSLFILSQENGINDVTTMKAWMQKLFFTHINEPALLICDAYDPHSSVQDILNDELEERNVTIKVIPEGCSSRLLPTTFSISSFIKVELRDRWHRWQCENSFTNSTRKFPKCSDISKWIEEIHQILSEEKKEMLKESFHKAGIMEDSSVGLFNDIESIFNETLEYINRFDSSDSTV